MASTHVSVLQWSAIVVVGVGVEARILIQFNYPACLFFLSLWLAIWTNFNVSAEGCLTEIVLCPSPIIKPSLYGSHSLKLTVNFR